MLQATYERSGCSVGLGLSKPQNTQKTVTYSFQNHIMIVTTFEELPGDYVIRSSHC